VSASSRLNKKAFITGIEGQDGSYLAELLLAKNYEVHGTFRPAGDGGAGNLQLLKADARVLQKTLFLHPADLDDAEAIRVPLEQCAPDEVYHLASQSHVGQSFEMVEETCRITGMGTLRLLELTRKLREPPRFFHASSSEIFGNPEQSPQDENTPVAPITPYGCAKAFGTQMTRIYRKNFGLFAVNGILFNHESPRRGGNFVTRKICRAVATIKAGRQAELVLGDTSAQRDWGNARDYVRGMWLALQPTRRRKIMCLPPAGCIAFRTLSNWLSRPPGWIGKSIVRQEKQLFPSGGPAPGRGQRRQGKKYLWAGSRKYPLNRP
jgi:GDPmannose 4,6-dehydratase